MLLSGSRLLAALGCFALAGWATYAIVSGSPDLVRMAWWFAGAVLLHDLVLFPLYAAGDRLLCSRCPAPGYRWSTTSGSRCSARGSRC